MRKLEINLPPELESFVTKQITNHQFADADTMVAHALAMLKAFTPLENGITKENMPIELVRGIGEAERGELFDADEVFDKIEADFRRQIEQGS
jgi:hypothetical protein